MSFELWPAVVAGTAAGLAMLLFRAVLRLLGVDLKLSMPRMWGTMIKAHGVVGRVAGVAIHLLASAAIGVFYAWVMARAGAADMLWLWGVFGGALHWIAAGLFMIVVPPLHPEVPERLPAPGPFLVNYGQTDMVALLAGHLLYGVLTAVIYAYLHTDGGAAVAF